MFLVIFRELDIETAGINLDKAIEQSLFAVGLGRNFRLVKGPGFVVLFRRASAREEAQVQREEGSPCFAAKA